MTYVLVALVAAVLAAVAVKSMQKSDPKRFGLAEAEAAAKPVMGVVCGVLGFENTVDADLQKLADGQNIDAVNREGEMKANAAEIARLETEIGKVKAVNAALGKEGLDALNLFADKAKVAALFKS